MVTYERKYDALIKEVRGLEGDLADYNLSMDKARTSTVRGGVATTACTPCAFCTSTTAYPHAAGRPQGIMHPMRGSTRNVHACHCQYLQDASEIVAFRDALKRRNEATSRDVDGVFMERQERERGAHRLEEQIAEIARASEARMTALAPPLQAEYRALADETKSLSAEIASQQAALEAINSHVDAAEGALRRDRVRDEYALLEKKVGAARSESGGRGGGAPSIG